MPEPELIPDGDEVSRLLFAPSMGSLGADLVWENVFQFPTNDGQSESVVWRKYATTVADVHSLGCGIQSEKRAAGRNATYIGAVTATVARILEVKSATGAGFSVIHVPDEGIHHAHILYAFTGQLTKNDKAELKSGLKKVFGQRSDHVCQEAA